MRLPAEVFEMRVIQFGPTMGRATHTEQHDHDHSVKFYASDDSLFAAVGTFLATGLAEKHPAIVIATPAHTEGILRELRLHLIDIERAVRGKYLTLWDAQETLATFMDGDRPTPHLFQQHVGSLVSALVREHEGQAIVRAYGEMVDLLWKDRRRDAAIRVELLWNSLRAQCGFDLLCGYALGDFYLETTGFEQVCAQHTRVMPPDAQVNATIQ
jgi:hypothetical protein